MTMPAGEELSPEELEASEPNPTNAQVANATIVPGTD